MTQTIEDATRQHLAAFLPDAISQALKSYYRFAQQDPLPEPKEFSDHHKACKVAIAHIELLIKLAKWADLPHKDAGTPNDQVILDGMVEKAQEELSAYHSRWQNKNSKNTS